MGIGDAGGLPDTLPDLAGFDRDINEICGDCTGRIGIGRDLLGGRVADFIQRLELRGFAGLGTKREHQSEEKAKPENAEHEPFEEFTHR